MTALGVFHHGDPDWYYALNHDQQMAVHAVLDLVEGDDPARFDLPIPMTGMMFGELRELKVSRRRSPSAPVGQRITVVDGKQKRPATDDEERAFSGAADAMMRKALLANGWTEKSLNFWFTPNEPVDLQAYAREVAAKRKAVRAAKQTGQA